jgi:hypothetical protein
VPARQTATTAAPGGANGINDEGFGHGVLQGVNNES